MTMITGKENIAKVRVLALKGALNMELRGLKRRGQSAYSIIKQEFGFKGNKQRVYDQLVAYCNEHIFPKQ